MFEISFPVKQCEIDNVLNKLITIGLDSTYYDAPYEVTVDSNGYGFFEKENEFTELKIYPSEDEKEACLEHIERIKELLDIKEEIKKITEKYSQEDSDVME